MKDRSVLKTIIVCVTAIICVCIGSYVYYEVNRYYVHGSNYGAGGYVVDKYNGKAYGSDGDIDNYFRNKSK